MKLRTNLLLGLSILLVVLLSLLVLGWFQLSSLNRTNENLQKNYELSSMAGEIHISVKNVAMGLRNITFMDDPIAFEKEVALIRAEDEFILKNISLMAVNSQTAEEKQGVRHLQETYDEFHQYMDSIINMIHSGQKSEAQNLMLQKSHAYHTQFFEDVSGITGDFKSSFHDSLTNDLHTIKNRIAISAFISLIVISGIIGYLFRNIWKVVDRLRQIAHTMSDITDGKLALTTNIEVRSNDEIDEVAQSFNRMTTSLYEQKIIDENRTWKKEHIADITTTLTGIHDIDGLSNTFLSKTVPLLGAAQAVIYLKEVDAHGEAIFKINSSYAAFDKEKLSQTFRLGEGLVGQVALEQKPMIFRDIPADYLKIKSGLGEATPISLYVLPVIFEDEVSAVIEIASFTYFNETQSALLQETVRNFAIILESVVSRIQLAKLLEETQILMEEIQVQSEELQSQQEELRITNEELEHQSQILRSSEEELQAQQKVLEETNGELEDKANMLAEQNQMLLSANQEVERARVELENRAKQLTLSSKYKSEFLANVSHELRTPLNSLLILSKLLADNNDGNLSEKQEEYARTIYHSGKDLLTLINDILDLAKIESGKMEVSPVQIQMMDLVELLQQRFNPIAKEKKVNFKVDFMEGLPSTLYSDEKRLMQVLENLLSNAFKFTHDGEVLLQIGCQYDQCNQRHFVFSIHDTGIGIPKEKQNLIFEAFQQADGTTSRKYGGTGLGLSICRKMAELLGGKITVTSEEGKGSTFTFTMVDYTKKMPEPRTFYLDEVSATSEISLETIDVAESISTLPVIDSIKVSKRSSLIKRLLIVDGDIHQRNELMEMIGDLDVIIKAVSTGHEAIEQLKVNQYDCIVLDLRLSDTSGVQLLEEIRQNGNAKTKVFIYTAKELSPKEELYLNKYVHSIIIKDEHAPIRLKDELELFLHSDDTGQETLKAGAGYELFPDLKGKKILLVDDDVRNVFALSNVLELYGMNVTFAENGVEALELLEKDQPFDLVLMDIMMPEMDGYEAIGRLRAMPECNDLPVIALTAKAMKEDREKCIEVGASDYIVKPVVPEQLISLMRVWLYKREGKQDWE
ncbi:response regulator [Pseudoneobacillus sp. C159]